MEAATNPVFCPNRQIKVLFSPGHGAGWVTYAPRNATDAFLVWMLTYEPLIEALEHRSKPERLEELMSTFHHEAHVRFGYDRLMTARATDLFVARVAGAFEVRGIDGQERLVDVTRRRDIVMAVHIGGGDHEREHEMREREAHDVRERELHEMAEAHQRGMTPTSPRIPDKRL